MADVPQKSRKQIMRNSFEQAKSRHLTDNVENKWFSNLHENVNSATSENDESQSKWFSNVHENVNSAKTRNMNIPLGILPEPRKRHLLLPRPLSLDAFCAQMAPHIFPNLDEPPHVTSRSDMPPKAFMLPVEPLTDFDRSLMLISRARPLRSHGARLLPKTDGFDNTVGPVPTASGYVFNTLQTNSAAHVMNTNENTERNDTHICDLDLYETVFQNWCITDQLNLSGVTSPDANASSKASHNPSFTDSNSTHCGDELSEDILRGAKSYNFTGSVISTMPVEINNRMKIASFTYVKY